MDFQNTMPWPSVADGVITMANGLRIEFTEPGREVRLSYRSADGRCAFEVTQTAVTPLLAWGHVMPGEDETGRRHLLTGRALAMAQLPSWPNNLFLDSVYEWTDERGRLAHCTYQEAWYASFQRLMRSGQ